MSVESDNQAKNPAVFISWISAILILAGLFWVLTQPLRTRTLVRAVNRVLEQSEDFRRLNEYSTNGGAGFFGMNAQFIVSGDAAGMKAVVFPFLGEGTFFPCLAMLNADGRVVEFIPLNNHGKRVMSRMSPGILQIYVRRIEGNTL